MALTVLLTGGVAAKTYAALPTWREGSGMEAKAGLLAERALKEIALLFLVLAVVSVPAASTASREAGADIRPNILLILTDDQDPESLDG